jgi:hypothetical protein
MAGAVDAEWKAPGKASIQEAWAGAALLDPLAPRHVPGVGPAPVTRLA